MPAQGRILIVDDDAANRKLVAALITRAECVPVMATGGKEALDILVREPIDLVLLDIMMPEVDGLAVLDELKKWGVLPALPVVVITASEDRAVRIEALKAGAIDFISKPIDYLEVSCKIQTLLELKRLRDITHSQLDSLSSRLNAIYASVPDNIVALDRNGIIQFVSHPHDPCKELVVGASWLVPSFADSHREMEAALSLVLTSGESTTFETSIQGSTNKRWYSNHIGPIVLNDTIVGTVICMRDVTLAKQSAAEQERLWEALATSRKTEALGKLAGGIAHDFNNILAIILSYGSFLEESSPQSAEWRSDLAEIRKAGEQGVNLTKQMLTFSRKQPTTKVPTDLNNVLTELQKLLSKTIGKHIQFSVELSPFPAIVRIDPIQFDQIVVNLAINARDAMPDGGRLRIALEVIEESGKWVRLTVSDNGLGMDEATKERIFEPFFSTKAKGKGTGLGLAICLGIISDIDGTIQITSTPGKGTTFQIDLPFCAEMVTTSRIEQHEISGVGQGENTLVVDDDEALRFASARILENAGYTVHVASNGNEAKQKIDELGSLLKVIVSDVMMPECSGYSVAEHASQVSPHAIIILTSGYFDLEVLPNYRDDLLVLWKPVAPQKLVQAVAQALALKRSVKPIT
jgi:signal transduction histidine kinase